MRLGCQKKLTEQSYAQASLCVLCPLVYIEGNGVHGLYIQVSLFLSFPLFLSGLYLQVSLSLFSRYVQGGLNPGKKPVNIGKVFMSSFLPNGAYQVRYLVNSQYKSIMKMGTLKARSYEAIPHILY